jgi:hypothetical protein
VDLNLGTSTVATALREVTGVGRGALRELYRGHGDLGDVAAVSGGGRGGEGEGRGDVAAVSGGGWGGEGRGIWS